MPGNMPAAQPGAAIKITPSRQVVDRRDPSISFAVTAEGFLAFDVLLTSDPALFDARNADRRTALNFRSSRQDFDGESIPAELGFYMTPTAFLGALVTVTPPPERLYYVAVGYRTADRTSGEFSVPADRLPSMAPSVQLAANLSGASLSTVLGVAVERLGQVGLSRRIARARPLSEVGMPQQTIGGLPVHRSPEPMAPTHGEAMPPSPAAGPHVEPVPGPVNGNGQAQNGGPSPDTAPAETPPATLRPAAGNGTAPSPIAPPNDGRTVPDGAPAGGPYFDEDAVYGAPATPENGNGYHDLDAPRQVPDPDSPPADDYDDGYGPPVAAAPADPAAPGTAGAASQPQNGAAPHGNEGHHGPGNGTTVPHGGPAIPGLDPGPGPTPDNLLPPEPASAAQGLGSHHTAPRLYHSLTSDSLPLASKMAIVEVIPQFEGAGRYDALNLDGEFRGRFGEDNPYYNTAHVGLSYGLVQFTQDGGSLGELLTLMRGKAPELFAEVFGPSADQLVAVTTASGPGSLHVEGGRSARVQPVDGTDLWQEPWISRFREAATHEPFREAQREVAVSRYFDPIMPYARWLGLWTQRGLAMLYDRSVQQGASGGMRFVVDAAGPVDTTAKRTAALEALGHATLEDFQTAAGISPDGDWGKQSHAAMIAALRRLGDASPVQLPDYDETLDLIVAASASRSFAHRVSRLRASETLSDQPITE